VVVALGGLGVDLWRHGDGDLGAADRRVLGRTEDLGVLGGELHGGIPQGAAELAQDRRAGDAVVAVLVVCADAAQLVAAELPCALVVGCGLVLARLATKRADVEAGLGVAEQ
jgi:hypothetical protein